MGKRRKNTGVTNSTPPAKKSTTNTMSDNEADQLPKWEAHSRNIISLLSHMVRQQQAIIDSMNKDIQQEVSDGIAAEKRSRTVVIRGAAESTAKKPSDRVWRTQRWSWKSWTRSEWLLSRPAHSGWVS
ncbi:hypothetical protein AAVH_41931 [Aphelenchoides avenae]|nr:hypothetical protein AAVH_41931 [Aphelenchus avenae]